MTNGRCRAAVKTHQPALPTGYKPAPVPDIAEYKNRPVDIATTGRPVIHQRKRTAPVPDDGGSGEIAGSVGSGPSRSAWTSVVISVASCRERGLADAVHARGVR